MFSENAKSVKCNSGPTLPLVFKWPSTRPTSSSATCTTRPTMTSSNPYCQPWWSPRSQSVKLSRFRSLTRIKWFFPVRFNRIQKTLCTVLLNVFNIYFLVTLFDAYEGFDCGSYLSYNYRVAKDHLIVKSMILSK